MNRNINLNRRALMVSALAGAALVAVPRGAFAALDTAQASALITRAVNDVNAAIASGQTGPKLYARFETIFNTYADVPTIARSALGSAARQASPAQLNAFTAAYRSYLARKYGKRFNEFRGAKFQVQNARQVKTFYEVATTAILPGQKPFQVQWQVSDKSGKNLFFNIIVEGVNMLASERTEIGAMLDQQKGSIDGLIQALNSAG
ncbi:MlaC/ttg2D family ABC transporter substrate-binding protein [Paenirhodobacter sp.]|uniref:MlaC/ttg2D family ABC transporter substrate-binding protein n=1 Tax=Paenirhodobacter sp. TaxID=1965326 RepID=UPI003B40F833